MKTKRDYKVTISMLLLFSLVASISLIGNTNGNQNDISEEIYTSLTTIKLTPSPAISIIGDGGFSGFPGTGSELDPYIIENYEINVLLDDFGIYIQNTTKHFVIQNCQVAANYVGIYLDNVGDGTGLITGNLCNDTDSGIVVDSSSGITVSNNKCINNDDGINILLSSNNIVNGNNLTHNEDGLKIRLSQNTTATNNDIIDSTLHGIRIEDGDNNTIKMNLFQDTKRYAINILDIGNSVSKSENNTIVENIFIDNNIGYGNQAQAQDNCINNWWYDETTKKGNFWSDWSGTGNYSIDGDANAVDMYPGFPPEQETNLWLYTIILSSLSITLASLSIIIIRRRRS